AIFGFRGTDPALMDAALVEILGEDQPETLPQSWRTRPELVEITSELFAPAFDRRGIPASRVRLTPAREEPQGLGAVLERWTLAPMEGEKRLNKAQELLALASGVK